MDFKAPSSSGVYIWWIRKENADVSKIQLKILKEYVMVYIITKFLYSSFFQSEVKEKISFAPLPTKKRGPKISSSILLSKYGNTLNTSHTSCVINETSLSALKELLRNTGLRKWEDLLNRRTETSIFLVWNFFEWLL